MSGSTHSFIVDADSPWCEPPDLFTRMAPDEYKDQVPRVETVDGQKMWVFDGHPVGCFSAGGVIDRNGVKEEANIALHEWEHEMVHVGAWDPKGRPSPLQSVEAKMSALAPETRAKIMGENARKLYRL